MPISCQLQVRCLTSEEFERVDYRVMGQAFACQNDLGRLCEEGNYQRDLAARLMAEGFRDVHSEVPITVTHRDFSKTYFVDLVVDDAVYELKTVAALAGEHQAQLLNYLYLLGIHRGKLINFRPPRVQGRIHATSLTPDDRRRVHFDAARWQDFSPACTTLRETMEALIADWGAFLDFTLYQEALTHFLGGASRVLQRLPLRRDSVPLGTQAFHVQAPGAAFRVSAITEQIEATESHLRRLLALTDLQVLQWINLDHATIKFVTITK